MRRDSRGQSDTVGVVLLTAVFVVLAVIVGAFLLSNFDDSDQTKPTVDIASDIDGQTVMIDHRGGNRYEAAEIRVVIREQDSDDRQYSLDEFTLMSGGDEGGFAPGDRWKKTIADLDGEFRLLVVDDSNGEIIHQEIHVAA